MSKKARIVLLVLFGIATIFAVFIGLSPQKKTDVAVVKNAAVTFKNVVVNADVADTEVLREKGLSGRVSLPDGEGMWFVYPEASIYSYWMPDMHFPIDIIWFDGSFRAVYIQENATPESYPHIFTPDVPAQYVLEVPAGFVKKYGVSPGEEVSVTISTGNP